jgi:hypothetical protein
VSTLAFPEEVPAMPGPRSRLAQSLVLTPPERSELERLVRAPTAAQGLARRARVVLLLADGHSVSATARRVGVDRRTARQWAARFRAARLAGLTDRPRSGRPPVFPPSGGGADGGLGLHAAR